MADALGLNVPKQPEQPINHSIPADGNPAKFQPRSADQGLDRSEALSMANTKKDSIKTRKIAILAANGVDNAALQNMKNELTAAGAVVEIIAPKLGEITSAKGAAVKVDKNLMTVSSVLYDAVYVPGGKESIGNLMDEADAVYFINQAYKHCKPIGVELDAEPLVALTAIGPILEKDKAAPGFVFNPGKGNSFPRAFIKAVSNHRFWEREKIGKEKKTGVPA